MMNCRTGYQAKGDQLGPEFPRREPGRVLEKARPEAQLRFWRPRVRILRPRRSRLDSTHRPLEVKTSRREARRRTPARLRVPAADDRARSSSVASPGPGRAQRTQASASSSGGERTGSRGPRKANKRPGRAAFQCPATVRQPAGSHGGLPLPEPRLSQAQPRRHARGTLAPLMLRTVGSKAPASAPTQRQGRSRRPLLKDRQAAPRTKASAGHMRTRRQSRLGADTAGHPESSTGGRAGPRCSARQWLGGPSGDRAASLAGPAVRFTGEPQHHLPRSRPALRAEVGRARRRKIIMRISPSVGQQPGSCLSPAENLRCSSPGGGGKFRCFSLAFKPSQQGLIRPHLTLQQTHTLRGLLSRLINPPSCALPVSETPKMLSL